MAGGVMVGGGLRSIQRLMREADVRRARALLAQRLASGMSPDLANDLFVTSLLAASLSAELSK